MSDQAFHSPKEEPGQQILDQFLGRNASLLKLIECGVMAIRVRAFKDI